MTRKSVVAALACLALAALEGCGPAETKQAVKLPRPVTVFPLVESNPNQVNRLPGSVASWKTEALGFEVAGRVTFVVEPETDIIGRIYGRNADEGSADETENRILIKEGQKLATLEEERYQLAIQSVKAQIGTATQQKKALGIEVASVIPAQKAAAVADQVFRKSEWDRQSELYKKNAASKSQADKAKAEHDAAVAKVAQIDATKESKQAEEASLQAKIDELTESLANAERDLADCVLRSPFSGQIAKVHVIPGGFVERGQPVVTIQMMDPIKIDIEVSAETSRTLHYRDVMRVALPDSTDDDDDVEASVYTIDPVADPATRTFTVTLLLRNEKVQTAAPEELGKDVVRAQDIWRFLRHPEIKEDRWFIEETAIQGEGDERFVWHVTNREQVARRETTILEVAKVKVVPGKLILPWLGLYNFREVAIAEGQDFDPQTGFAAANLDSAEPPADGKMLLDRQQWRLRPGDLVSVDLAGGVMPSGFYVPMDVIQSAEGKSFVFVAEDGKARRVEVLVSDGPNTSKRIEPQEGQQLGAGALLIARGVHFLTDGEAVKIVEELEPRQ